MAAITAGVIGAGATAYGAYSANRSAKDQVKVQQQAMQQAQQASYLGNFRANDWGSGAWAGFTDNSGTMGMSHGNLEAAYNALRQGASGIATNINDMSALAPYNQAVADAQHAAFRNWGNTQEIQHALEGYGGPNLELGGLNSLEAQLGAQQSGAANRMSAFAGSIPGTYDQVYGNTLSNLREQAGVQNSRAFSGLQDNLFATGRMGTSGGALQTEAFARGLAQADAGYQLQAQQQAIAAQQQQQSLLNDAFGQWSQTSSMLGDINSERFQRSMYGNETGYSRLQDQLNVRLGLDQMQYDRRNDLVALAQQQALAPLGYQDARMGNMQSMLAAQAGIQGQGLEMFGAGLNAQIAAANARLGGSSNIAQIAGSPSFGAAGQASAAMWGQLGTSLMNNSSQIGSFFTPQVQQPDWQSAIRQAEASGALGRIGAPINVY